VLKTNQAGFFKDPTTGAIVNTDLRPLEAVKAARAEYKKSREEIEAIKRDVLNLILKLDAVMNKLGINV